MTPRDEPPSLLERAGCFTFVAAPLVFGLPVAQAWAHVVGGWLIPLYVALAAALLLFIIYLLEQEDGVKG